MDKDKNKNPVRSIDVYNCYSVEGCDYKLVISRSRNPLSIFINKEQANELIESLQSHGAGRCDIKDSIIHLINSRDIKDTISDIVRETIIEHENEDRYS